MEDGTLAFTAKADMDTVIQQYKAGLLEAINRIAAKEEWNARVLNFFNLGWGDAEAAELGETLRWAAAHCDFPRGSVLVGICDGNQISDDGVKALLDAIAGGALGQLKELDLDGNRISDDGMKALADALAGGALGQLKELGLDGNPAGRAAHQAAKDALKNRQ